MKKVKKVVALSMGVLMATSLLAGCSTDAASLFNGFEKSATITSEETQTDISLNVTGTNESAQEKQILDKELPLINSSKISVTTKINKNAAKKYLKSEEDFNLQLGETPISTTVWANEDLTGDKPSINEIFKVPQLVSAQLPTKFQGKEYAVINTNDIKTDPNSPQIDYKKLLTFSQDFQPKLLAFISKYATQFNPTSTYITSVGASSYSQNGVNLKNNIYELKLTDKSLKDLIHYSLTNLSTNTDAMNLAKDYVSGMASIYGITDTTQLNAITNNLPKQLLTLNTKLVALDNLKILGDNGIDIRYTVNSDGYISNEKGTAQFVVDSPSIIKLVAANKGTTNANDPTGIYTINLGFNTDITNINGDVAITFPTLNSTNSFNYTDLINSAPSATNSAVKQSIINQLIVKK